MKVGDLVRIHTDRDPTWPHTYPGADGQLAAIESTGTRFARVAVLGAGAVYRLLVPIAQLELAKEFDLLLPSTN